jgi:glycosyltransferase involved in cell wall biosynthesis
MFKVAVVSRYFPSSVEPSGGRSLYQTLRVLARKIDVHVFYPNAVYPRFIGTRGILGKRLDTSYSPDGVGVSYYNYPALPLLSRPINSTMAARMLLPHVRDYAPDIVFGCFLYPAGHIALKIGRSLSVPVVSKSIGSDINLKVDPISVAYTNVVLRESDHLITVSEDLRRKAIARGAQPEKTRAVLNGCDLSTFRVQDKAEARRKLNLPVSVQAAAYIGRMDIHKGIRELAHAAMLLRPTRPNLHFYLVGDGPDGPLVEKFVKENKATDFIHIRPGCNFDEVAGWMAASDLTVLPSYMEGCPNAVLESLACGRPVVATQVGGVPEILDNTCGRLVPPRDSDALAQAIASVLDTHWDASTISKYRARGWEDTASEVLEVFENAVRTYRPGPRRY